MPETTSNDGFFGATAFFYQTHIWQTFLRKARLSFIVWSIEQYVQFSHQTTGLTCKFVERQSDGKYDWAYYPLSTSEHVAHRNQTGISNV